MTNGGVPVRDNIVLLNPPVESQLLDQVGNNVRHG